MGQHWVTAVAGERRGGRRLEQGWVTITQPSTGLLLPGALPRSCVWGSSRWQGGQGWLVGDCSSVPGDMPAWWWPCCVVRAAEQPTPVSPSRAMWGQAAGDNPGSHWHGGCHWHRGLTLGLCLLQMQSRAAAPGQALARTRKTANPSRWVSAAGRAWAKDKGHPSLSPGALPWRGRGAYDMQSSCQPLPATAWPLQ